MYVYADTNKIYKQENKKDLNEYSTKNNPVN